MLGVGSWDLGMVGRWKLVVGSSLLDRRRPEVDHAAVDVERLGWLRLAHVEGMRDDAGPWLDVVVQLWQQLEVERGQQIQRDDRRLADVGGEEILVEELHAIADAGALEILGRFLDALRIDVDA